MKKLLILPKYSAMGPSSRYRIYNYLPYYKDAGIQYEVLPLLGDWYLKNLWGKKSVARVADKMIASYFKRFIRLLTVEKDTIVYIGAELFPYLPYGIEEYLKLRHIPYIIEFDDAIFHNYDSSHNRLKKLLFGRKTEKVIASASAVIGGCQYLCDYARQWNDNVIEIPTSIDRDKYNVPVLNHSKPVIGWIGSPASVKYLDMIIEPLKRLSHETDFSVRLIGCNPQFSAQLDGINHEIIPWSDDTEIAEMQKFSIGIMPLDDTLFSRGKCAFKLVQYMAMGLPTISTPLLSNVNISKGNGNLFASTSEEWYEALKQSLSNREMFNQIGLKNREIAFREYSFQENWKKYVELFSSL